MPKPKKIHHSLKLRLVFPSVALLLTGCIVFIGLTSGGTARTLEVGQMTLKVPVPLSTIKRGTALSEVEFTMVDWPEDKILSDFVLDKRVLEGLRANSALPKMLPVSKMSVVRNVGEGNPVVGKIPRGMRAISVKVDRESAVEGWAGSGNFVDVIVIKSSRTKSDGLEAKVIAENVQILSADRSVREVISGFKAPTLPDTVTLLTSQEAALRIKTAQQLGRLTFALRGTSDSLPTVTQTLTKEDFLYQGLENETNSDIYLGTAVGPDGSRFGLHEKFGWIELSND